MSLAKRPVPRGRGTRRDVSSDPAGLRYRLNSWNLAPAVP
ncbi:hypothetical protein QFZ61_002385 [Arthrobacter sp. B3I4]|nr:hypothetical protein [Arthrobacter sp. B3I4]